MVADALEIFRTKHQVSAEAHGDGLFHHVGKKLLG